MRFSKIIGNRKQHKVILFSISTCTWCKITKDFLKDNQVEFTYLNVDLLNEEEKEKIKQIICDKGGTLTFPTTIIDDKILITGFRKDKIKEALNF